MKPWILGFAAMTLLLCWGMDARAGDNLLINGDFETGDFTGWDKYGPNGFYTITAFWIEPVHGGDYAAQFAGFESDASLYQTIDTTVGATYQISYWLKSDGNLPNDARVTFGDEVLFSGVDLDAFPYTEFRFMVQATASTSTLEFAVRDDPGYFRLDDVSVTLVPEPSTLILLAAGAIGLLGFAWRRRMAQGIESY
jgi:hypothetical protein